MSEKGRAMVSLLLIALMLVVIIPYNSTDSSGRDTGSSPIESLDILPNGDHWGMAWTDKAEYATIVGEKELYLYKEAGNEVINYSSFVGDTKLHDVEYDSYDDNMVMVGSVNGYGKIDRFHYAPPCSTVEHYYGNSLTLNSAIKVTGDDAEWNCRNEYVYLSNSTQYVSTGDYRLTDAPEATWSYGESGGAYPSDIHLQKMPSAEQIYCNYTETPGSWSVWGTQSGQQTQTAQTGNSYTLDTGVNSGKVTFTIKDSNPKNGHQVIIYIDVNPSGYSARSIVNGEDSDINTTLKDLDNATDYQYGNDYNYVLDMDGDGYLTEGDIRITAQVDFWNDYTASSGSEFYDIALNTSSQYCAPLMAVGYNSEIAISDGGGWSSYDLPAPYNTSSYDFYGVTLDENTGRFYFVGENGTNEHSKPVAFVALPDGSGSYIFHEISTNLPPVSGFDIFINVDWNDKYNFGIAVGADDNVYKFQYDYYNDTTTWTRLWSGPSSSYMQAVKWTPDNERAIMGDDTNNIYSYDVSTGLVSYIGQVPGGGSGIFDVAMRPHASTPYATVIGWNTLGNYYYTTSSTGSSVTTNVDLPTIADYDIKNAAGNSILNAMTDVDSTYMFYIDAYYEMSGNVNAWDRTTMDIYAWNDENNGQTSYPAEGVDNSCTQFHLNYTGGSNGAATGSWVVIFPYLGQENYREVSIVNQSESFATEADGYEHHYFYINVSFGPQMLYSGNTAMTDSGDSTESAGYNDAGTWNMEIRATDSTSSMNKDSKYTEFGLYKYTAITVSGNPSGGAPPGMSVNMSTPNRVYYSANIDYQVKVKIGDLKNAAGDIIPASRVSVVAPDADGGDSGISVKKYFSGPDSELLVWDLSAPYLGGNGTFGDIQGGDILPYVQYQSGTSVSSNDYDLSRHLNAAVDACVSGSDDTWTPGSDFVYLDEDHDYMVSEGDIRVTSYGGYRSGSTVSAGDSDVGTALQDLNGAAVTGADGIWSPHVDEFIIDEDNNGQISASDMRVGPTYLVTGVYWYVDIPAGTPRGSYTTTITYTIYHP